MPMGESLAGGSEPRYLHDIISDDFYPPTPVKYDLGWVHGTDRGCEYVRQGRLHRPQYCIVSGGTIVEVYSF